MHVATPWGRAALVEEIELAQASGERRFGVRVQLLEGARGEEYVRFAYTTGDSARRGPVTLRKRDLAKLQKLLVRRPRLAALLGADGGDAAGTG
jgi:hypothetical protein